MSSSCAIRAATERGDIGGPERRGRDHLDHIGADELELRCELTTRPQQVGAAHAPRLRGASTGRERRVEDIDVDRGERRPGPNRLDRLGEHLGNATVEDLAHAQRRDPALALPGELLLTGPVTAQADLGVALSGNVPLLDQPVHRGSVRAFDPPELATGVGVGVEVDQPERAVALGTGTDIGLGDRVVPAEYERDRPGVDHIADDALDRRVRGDRVGRDHRRVAEVHHPQRLERIDPGVEVHPADGVAREPDRPRTEARAGKLRDELVQGRADDSHINPG